LRLKALEAKAASHCKPKALDIPKETTQNPLSTVKSKLKKLSLNSK